MWRNCNRDIIAKVARLVASLLLVFAIFATLQMVAISLNEYGRTTEVIQTQREAYEMLLPGVAYAAPQGNAQNNLVYLIESDTK